MLAATSPSQRQTTVLIIIVSRYQPEPETDNGSHYRRCLATCGLLAPCTFEEYCVVAFVQGCPVSFRVIGSRRLGGRRPFVLVRVGSGIASCQY